jgi:high-affinity iron transporter
MQPGRGVVWPVMPRRHWRRRPRSPIRTMSVRHRYCGSLAARRSLLGLVCVGTLVVSAVLADLPAAGATGKATDRITITNGKCAASWMAPPVGRDTFVIENQTTRSGAIYLFDPYTGRTAGSRSGLQPGATATIRVNVKPGHYTWGCHMQGLAQYQSSDLTVRPAPVMTAAGPTTEISVTPAQLAGPLTAYRTYVTQQLGLLATQVTELQSAVASGQLSSAETSWLTAHLTWQRLGAAYDAFGTLGTQINGLATGQNVGDIPGTPGGTDFEGFHKIELDLWGHQDLAAAGIDADQLAANLTRLTAKFPLDDIPPAELPLRAHEILEDSQRDELSGDDDYGSGTDMASVEADVEGERVLLQILTPLLNERAPDLVPRVTAQLDRLDGALAATQQNGQWVAVAQVPLAQRQQVDGAMGAALEILAVIPDVMPVTGSNL